MKRKFLAYLLAIALTATLGGPVFAKGPAGLEASTISDLDPTGANLEPKSPKNSVVTLEAAEFGAGTIRLKGALKFDGAETPFALSGNLFRSERSDLRLLGSLEDASGNFDVIHFSVDKDPDSGIVIDKSVGNRKGMLLKLYLLRKGTREFTYLEVLDPAILADTPIDKAANFADYPVGAHIDEFWYAKVLRPALEAEASSTGTTGSSLGDVGIQAIISDYVDVTYTYGYNVAGTWVYEEFKVRHYMEGPDSITNYGTFYAQLKVVSERTFSLTDPRFNSSQTNTRIGAGPTYIHFYTDPGDQFASVAWDGIYRTSGSLQFTIGWNLTDPYTLLGFGVSYKSSKTHNAHTIQNFDNSGTNKTRQIKVEFASGLWLEDPNHAFFANPTVGYSGSPGNKRLYARFDYDISNGLDYSWGGRKIQDVSLGYRSGF